MGAAPPLLLLAACVASHSATGAHSFAPPRPSPSPNPNAPSRPRTNQRARGPPILRAAGDAEDKFSLFQRVESTKAAALGLVSGALSSAPFVALHDLPAYGAASWEFDTDMGSVMGALFAIVYRYCVREDDDNDMLNMGVVGAFALTRTLSRIRVPSYCTAAPLDCGDPLGYFDYDMLQQLALNGLESAALFGGAAACMEVAYGKKWISKFPN